jgi:hypothetical protein
VLRDHACSWARAAGGGCPPHQVRRAGELPELLEGHRGPVVLVAPDVPGVGPHHCAAALDDLAAGVLVTTAPATDGRPFLIALSRPEPRLLALATASFEELVAAAREGGGDLGLLRPERRLASVSDACAMAVDPLTPAALRDLVRILIR